MFKKGSTILVPFPFTDLSSQKIRPAVILSASAHGGDIVAAFISSRMEKRGAFDVAIKGAEKMESAGLKTSSVVKVGKIATLDKKIVLGELGTLDKDSLRDVDRKIRKLFGI